MKNVSMRYIFYLCAVMGFLYGCTDDTSEYAPEENRLAVQLGGVIGTNRDSRATDDGFCDGDRIGVYVVDYANGSPGILKLEGNRATNVGYTYSAGTTLWTPDYDVYYKDEKTAVDIYGYYPYATPDAVDKYSFEVRTDQHVSATSSELGGYEASDFLWAKASKVTPTDAVVKLSFSHRLSGVRVSLQMGSGFTSEEWNSLEKTVRILNTRTSAEINLSTGVATAVGDVNPVGIVAVQDGEDYRAIVIPQEIPSGTPLLGITVGGVNYSHQLSSAMVYAAGKLHSYVMRVDKKTPEGDYDFSLVSESVTVWEEDGVSHDVTAREYVVVECVAGQLEQCLKDAGKDHAKVQSLKLTGTMNAADFFFMRDKMGKLEALNLKEVVIQAAKVNYRSYADDVIPDNAFYTYSVNNVLKHLILPDQLKEIGREAFYSSILTGSLYIPEGVTKVGYMAFYNCKYLTGELSLPSTLTYLDYGAFGLCKFTGQLRLPETLSYIGDQAFSYCNFTGELHLPDQVEYLGEGAFGNCSSFTGSLVIPDQLTEIRSGTFSGCGFNGILKLPAGLKKIHSSAFSGTKFQGELILPNSLVMIGESAFSGSSFSGTLKLPSNLVVLGRWAFQNMGRIMGVVEIPEGIQVIPESLFYQCRNLEGFVLPSTLEAIQNDAFGYCYGLNSIVCKGGYPPALGNNVFYGVAKDNFVVEVPESAVPTYKLATGWGDFKRITAHHELVCRPSFACALNKAYTRELIVDAEGDWTVKSMPDWCSLSQTSGSKKTLVTLTINQLAKGSADRQGEIVFELTGKGYTTTCAVSQYDYEYEEDEFITLQESKLGKGVNIVFIGDGYDAKQMADGTYLKDMKQQVEDFFALPPYNTYQDYFRVYTGIAVSQESGVGTVNTICYNKFETTFRKELELRGNEDAIFEYVLRAPEVNADNLHQTLVVLTPNTTIYGGICKLFTDGSAIAYCPMSAEPYPFDRRGIVQHEAGGHGFGKLADEYIYYNAFIPFSKIKELENSQLLYGFFKNLSVSGKISDVPWNHLLFHEKYKEVVDIFEGGYEYNRGVFRSEHNSCMNNNVPYFNAYSRELIVRRIMEYAGLPFSFADFVAKDVMEPGKGAVTTRAFDAPIWQHSSYHRPPVVIEGSPSILNRKK